jgi:hypothetical protein
MNYPAITMNNAATELNRLHGEIEGKLRTTVQDAIRAGEILTQVKERMEHGEFLPWVERSCKFSRETGSRYMRLFEHQNKLVSVTNLQDAYKEVAQIESREKQTEEQKAQQRVKEYLKTGNKPEGWRRGTDDKLAEEEKRRDERIEQEKEKMRIAGEKQAAEKQRREEMRQEDKFADEMLRKAAENVTQNMNKRRAFKERIRLSQSGESDAFIDALMDYLEELESDNRRIEACQNIIKVCRNIAAELQRDKPQED